MVLLWHRFSPVDKYYITDIDYRYWYRLPVYHIATMLLYPIVGCLSVRILTAILTFAFYRLSVGQYIVKNNPRKKSVCIFKAAPNSDR